MAGFACVAKIQLLLLLATLATCRAQAPLPTPVVPLIMAPLISPQPIPISPNACAFVEPEESITTCPALLQSTNARFEQTANSVRYTTKFGLPGKYNSGIQEAIVVIDPLPVDLQVKRIGFNCQRRGSCKLVKPCFTNDRAIVASAKSARALEIKLVFGSVFTTSTVVTGTLYTTCGEKIPLTWNVGPLVPISGPGSIAPAPGVPVLVPEPTPAPDVPVLVAEPTPAPSTLPEFQPPLPSNGLGQ